MEITPFEIYLVMQMDSFCVLFSVLFLFMGGLALASVFVVCEYDTENKRRTLFKKVLMVTATLSVVSLLLAVFIPSSKTVAAMYVVPKIVNNENVQKIPDEMLQLFRESIKDMTPRKGKES